VELTLLSPSFYTVAAKRGTLRFSASLPVLCTSGGLLGSWVVGNRDLKSGCIYPLLISSFICELGLVLPMAVQTQRSQGISAPSSASMVRMWHLLSSLTR
jgi:hypothetical protein